MSQHSICIKLLCTAGLVGLVAAVPNARTASAQNLNDMVRTLNNVINPGDAQRLEDQIMIKSTGGKRPARRSSKR
jgi:hypothetical protein